MQQGGRQLRRQERVLTCRCLGGRSDESLAESELPPRSAVLPPRAHAHRQLMSGSSPGLPTVAGTQADTCSYSRHTRLPLGTSSRMGAGASASLSCRGKGPW